MGLPYGDWYRAIFTRISRRSFSPRLPETIKITRLEKLCAEFRPYPGARAVLIKQSPADVFSGIIGNYGKISGAPYYVAFIGDNTAPHVEEGIGYTGEAIILEATILELGTCWVSGFFRSAAVRNHINLEHGERVFAVTPIGYAERGLSAKDKFYRGAARSGKRKSLTEIVQGAVSFPWQEKALEAARLAPSASNRQPWQFLVEAGVISVRTTGSVDSVRYPKRLDCGIAMLHLELGARFAGARGTWTPLAAPGVARFEIDA